jgi:hypothetical protein
MSFAVLTNLVVIMLCGAVLVQSLRMMRSLGAVKNGALKETVAALETATCQARAVLGDLKETLRTDGAANARAVVQGEAMREELAILVGIANAAAERIVETAEGVKPAPPAPRRKPARRKAEQAAA